MPGFDGTGPVGRGSMTGRGRGWCMVEVDEREQVMGFGFGGCRNGNGRGLARRRRMAGVGAGFGRMDNVSEDNNASNATPWEGSDVLQKVVVTLDSISQKLDQLTAAIEKSSQEESA